MINTALVLGGIVLVIFMCFILGLVGASIYDLWYQRKYRTWIALQEDPDSKVKIATK